MAIVRGEDGRFFDIEDTQLDKHEIKPEDLPEGSVYARPAGGPPGGGGGAPHQLVINIGGGGPVGGGGPGAGPNPGNEGGKDVQAHGGCGWYNWYNWRNCGWRNYCA